MNHKVFRWWNTFTEKDQAAFAEHFFNINRSEMTEAKIEELFFKDLTEYDQEDGVIISPCPHCEEGTFEEMKACHKPMSDCCGGCTVTRTCDECNGSGIDRIEVDFEAGDLIVGYTTFDEVG